MQELFESGLLCFGTKG